MGRTKIIYRGKTFTKLRSGNCYLVTSLPYSELEANTLSVTVESDDRTLTEFNRGDPLVYHYRNRQVGTFYVQDIQRIATNQYEFHATSAIGILSEGKHYGGIYTGQTAQEVIADLCGSVPHTVKKGLQGVKLYGWLPIATSRENLAQVLFAMGATVTTDLDGVLHIEGIWDGFSGVTGANRLCIGSKVAYGTKVTQVSITEHQYIAIGEAKNLFEGTTEYGDMITFDEPMFDLVASGFTILESNANYARVSAGSGTLAGKPYTHNTRTVIRSVTSSDRPNIKAVEEATLVSLANSTAVADRMADYYQCIQTVEAPTIYTGERPGDRRYIFHPYDCKTVDACVKSVDINISNTLKAREKSLVGFVPSQSGEVEYFDYREIIDRDSTWTVPEGITVIRVVLIGGGQGGYSGNPGETAPKQTVITDTSEVTNARTNYIGTNPTEPGEGGAPGAAGHGGNVWQTTLDVQPGQVFSITSGKGGSGGAAGMETLEGTNGTDTVFGELSSAEGGVLPGGFLEEFEGQLYACQGGQGISGGRGAGRARMFAAIRVKAWRTAEAVTVQTTVTGNPPLRVVMEAAPPTEPTAIMVSPDTPESTPPVYPAKAAPVVREQTPCRRPRKLCMERGAWAATAAVAAAVPAAVCPPAVCRRSGILPAAAMWSQLKLPVSMPLRLHLPAVEKAAAAVRVPMAV